MLFVAFRARELEVQDLGFVDHGLELGDWVQGCRVEGDCMSQGLGFRVQGSDRFSSRHLNPKTLNPEP